MWVGFTALVLARIGSGSRSSATYYKEQKKQLLHLFQHNLLLKLLCKELGQGKLQVLKLMLLLRGMSFITVRSGGEPITTLLIEQIEQTP
jgi:hypothetical protein